MGLYFVKLQRIDLDRFEKETSEYNQWSRCVDRVMSEQELNIVLRKAMIDLDIQLPWTGDFDAFMRDEHAHLVFQ